MKTERQDIREDGMSEERTKERKILRTILETLAKRYRNLIWQVRSGRNTILERDQRDEGAMVARTDILVQATNAADLEYVLKHLKDLRTLTKQLLEPFTVYSTHALNECIRDLQEKKDKNARARQDSDTGDPQDASRIAAILQEPEPIMRYYPISESEKRGGW